MGPGLTLESGEFIPAGELNKMMNAKSKFAHVQNPAVIEHVAGDVSKNGAGSNMTQQPAPSAAKTECVHEWDGMVRTSMPPRYACKHCHNFFDAPPSPTPPADSQPAPDEVADAMADSQYLAGVSAGWNAANADDPNAALQKLHESRAGYLKPLSEARAPADSVTAPAGGETYHLGACIVEDMLHATVIRKEHGRAGAVTVLLSEQIPVENLQDRDVIVDATPPAQAADSAQEDADRYRWLFGARTDAQTVSVSETVFKPLPQDEVLSHLQGFYMSKTVVDALVDKARKQGANHD